MTNRASTKRRAPKAANTNSRPGTLAAVVGLSAVERDVLIALFQLSRDTQRISARTLADAVTQTPTQTGAALVQLEQKGVVDATRARLTMKGLVLAVQLGAGSGGPRVAAPKAVKAVAEQPALPVAALPSQRPPAPAPESVPPSAPDDHRDYGYGQSASLLC